MTMLDLGSGHSIPAAAVKAMLPAASPLGWELRWRRWGLQPREVSAEVRALLGRSRRVWEPPQHDAEHAVEWLTEPGRPTQSIVLTFDRRRLAVSAQPPTLADQLDAERPHL